MNRLRLIVLNVLILLLVASNSYYNEITIVVNNAGKPLNHTQIIAQYFQDINDDIVILPSMAVTNNICKHNLAPSARYILFIDSFEVFTQQCSDLQIITDSVLNNGSFRMLNVKWNKYHGSKSRHLLSANYNGWIAPTDPLLPRADFSIACASYNDTVYLFGGWQNRKQSVEFNIVSHTFTDKNALSINVYGSGQYYTQNNQIFYWIDGDSGNKIVNYDLSTKSILTSIAIPNYVGDESCLVSNKNLLFVVGGLAKSGSVLDSLQIYNMSSQAWLSGISSMRTTRARTACIVHPDYNMLYAIGGESGNQLESVERIQIHDIANNDWQHIADLTTARTMTPAIIYGDYILVFGGELPVHVTSEIISINAKTNAVASAGNLDYGIGGTSAIFTNQKIYLFGGFDSDDSVNKWQYLPLPTSAPTTNSPTTDSPTTDSSTTDIPTTDIPTTDIPTTDIPTTDSPTIDSPTTDIPTTDSPTTDNTMRPTMKQIQTVEPTKSPIFICIGSNGAIITVLMRYTITNNVNNSAIWNILSNVADNFVANQSTECEISSYNNEITIDSMRNMANITINICTNCDDTQLLAPFANELEKDLITMNNPILKVITNSTIITVSIIPKEGQIQTTTESDIDTTKTVNEQVQNDENSVFWPVITAFLVLLFICCIVMGFIVYTKRKKDMKFVNGIEFGVSRSNVFSNSTNVDIVEEGRRENKLINTTDVDKENNVINSNDDDTDSIDNNKGTMSSHFSSNIRMGVDDEIIIDDDDTPNDDAQYAMNGDMVINGDEDERVTSLNDDDNNNVELQHEGDTDHLDDFVVNTKGSFEQEVGDQNMGNNMIMDEIVDDINHQTPI